jgi:hypothetical protein
MLLPLVILLAYGIAYGIAALGGGLLIFDDHPGQLFRLWHALSRGLLPWEWNPDWWAGYPELQFYPPGYVYLGAALRILTLGAISTEAIYQVLLWIIYLLPGLAAFWLLARLLPNPWFALPTAFVVLTLSAGSLSGVEGGVRIGMIAARLGLGLLPLLALSLHRWQERGGKRPPWAVPLLAAVIISHPAHAPAAMLVVLLAALTGPARQTITRRLGQAAWVLVLGVAFTGFWMIPLIGHIEYALPLAWGEFSFGRLGREIFGRPVLSLAAVAYTAGIVLALSSERISRQARALLGLLPALLLALALDAFVIEPLGFRWLPSDRLVDSVFLALLLGAGIGIGWFLETGAGRLKAPGWAMALPLTAALFLLPSGGGEPDLTLWPRSGQWPKAGETIAGQGVDQLWEALRRTPPGRTLFIRSAVPLEQGQEWYRPHTHILSLTPITTRREIINGTFTHPSPIAGLIYHGSATPGSIRQLVETLDGKRLFGQPIESLGLETFAFLADRLRISAIVAQREDLGHLRFLEGEQAFDPPRAIGHFLLYIRKEPLSTPEPLTLRRFRITLLEHPGGWAPIGTAYYPLWEAEWVNGRLPLRRDEWGLIEVEAPPGKRVQVDLIYREGPWERIGMVVSGLAVILWAATAWWMAPTQEKASGRRETRL